MWLKKYTSVLKTTLKEVTAYRFDTLMSAAFSFLRIWLAYILWRAIFGSKEMISDYTFPMMLSYYIFITFFQRMAKSEDMIWETADEVREGTFTKYITRPVNHFTYSLFRSAGKALFFFIVDSLAFTLWIFLFRENFYFPRNPMAYLYSAGFMILGLFTVMQIHYLTSLISFKTVVIAGPWFFIKNIMDFMSGSFIPLMLLPSVIREIFSFTPFYYILYYPASLYLEQGWNRMGRALGVILIWNLILWGFRKIQFRRMIRFYEGVGA